LLKVAKYLQNWHISLWATACYVGQLAPTGVKVVSNRAAQEMGTTVKDDSKRHGDSYFQDEENKLYEGLRKQRQEFGEERWKLYTRGLLEFSLEELVHLWLGELNRVGLARGKDRSPLDVPLKEKSDAALVDASDGRKVWIRPDAYRDEEGHLLAEVREHYSRTDGAIWAALAVLEGGEGIEREGGLERTLLEDYEAWRPIVQDEDEGEALNPDNERLLECATAAAYSYHPNLDMYSEQDRREVVVGLAKRLHAVAKATREFQEYAERGRLGRKGDPVRDLYAAELHYIYGLTHEQVAERLQMRPQTDRDKDKGGHQAAEDVVKRGGKLMDQVYPGGRAEYIARHKKDTGSK